LNQGNFVYGKHINDFIQHIKLPICTITNLTGQTSNGLTFPVTVDLFKKEVNNEEIVYNCKAKQFKNISGLMTISVSDGLIKSYNPLMTRILFDFDENELKNRNICDLIPNFYENSSCYKSTILDDDAPLFQATMNEISSEIKHKNGTTIKINFKRLTMLQDKNVINIVISHESNSLEQLEVNRFFFTLINRFVK
jgi:hypothetical protein